MPKEPTAEGSQRNLGPAGDDGGAEETGAMETVAYDAQGEGESDNRTASMRLDSALQHELLSGWSQFKNAKDYASAPKEREEHTRTSLAPTDGEQVSSTTSTLPAIEVVHASSTKTSSAHYQGELNAEGRKHGIACYLSSVGCHILRQGAVHLQQWGLLRGYVRERQATREGQVCVHRWRDVRRR